MAVRRFTKNDWYGFAGAEVFADGTQPFIYDEDHGATGFVVVVDSTMASVFLGEDVCYGNTGAVILFPAQAQALATGIAAALVAAEPAHYDGILTVMGFERIN